MKTIIKAIALSLGLLLSAAANSTIIYDNWTSNNSFSGSYSLTISENAGRFDINLSVDPWDSEPLGLFIDLASSNYLSATDLDFQTTSAIAFDGFNSNSCSLGGCNLNGLGLPSLSNGTFDLAFAIGTQGANGIFAVDFSIDALGQDLSIFSTAAIRAQQTCDQGGVNSIGNYCDGSDKVWANINHHPRVLVPEPESILLLGLGLLLLVRSRKA